MQFDDKIIVMARKGTPAQPDDDGNLPPAAFTVCGICGKDLVYDERNKQRIHAEEITPMCGPCAADLVLHSGQPTIGTIQGMTAGEDSMDGVEQFLDQIADGVTRRPN